MPIKPQLVNTSATVLGMHCASCAENIKTTVKKIAGVSKCEINLATEQVRLEYDQTQVSLAEINQQLDKLGYQFQAESPPAPTELVSSPQASAQAQQLEALAVQRRQLQLVLPLAALTIAEMVASIWLASSPSDQLPPFISISLTLIRALIPLFATYILFVPGVVYLRALWRFLRYRVANMDSLVGLGALTAFSYSFLVSTFARELSPYFESDHLFYDATIVVIGFIMLGRYLESKSKLRTNRALTQLMNLEPTLAWVLRAEKVVEMPIAQVVVGDICLVKPGQVVPVDGEIVAGETAIDESMMTGESMPVEKAVGARVIGGSLNQHGSIQVRAKRVGAETFLRQIIQTVTEAQASKAPIEQLVDRVVAKFVPLVLILALLSLFGWLLIGPWFLPLPHAVALAITSFVSVLVVACPCTMGLATPLAIVVGVGRAAQNGILIKDAEQLQALSRVNLVVFDKTGTLTEGKPSLQRLERVEGTGLSEREALTLLASLEAHSEHPLARALVGAAEAQAFKLRPVKRFRALTGQGVQGEIAGRRYYAGSARLMIELGLQPEQVSTASPGDATIASPVLRSASVIYLARERQILAWALLADRIRAEAGATLAALQAKGVAVALLTGDNEESARQVASQLGIEHWRAALLPAEKLAYLKQLQQAGQRVAMVGDGINDAPALAQAEVGLAMGTGTDLAMEAAGVTLLAGKLTQLPSAFALATATMRTIKQTIFWAFFYNATLIPLAMGLFYPWTGWMLTPIWAGGAMALSSVSVVLSALRLQREQLPSTS